MRETGFYWVLLNDKWQVAEWCDVYWFIIGFDGAIVEDSHFEEIDERIIPREPHFPKFKALITGASPWKEKAEEGLAELNEDGLPDVCKQCGWEKCDCLTDNDE